MSKMKASRMIRLTLVSTSVAAALMLAGCSVIAPEKLSSDDLMRLANVDPVSYTHLTLPTILRV